MQTQFLYHLLGVCLLLIQLPGEVPGRRVAKSVKVCGREYTRLHNEVCSSANLRGHRNESKHAHRHPGKYQPDFRFTDVPDTSISSLPIPFYNLETSSSTNHNAEGLNIRVESGFMLPENLKSELPGNQPSRIGKRSGLQDAKLNSAEFKNINLKKLSKAKHHKNDNLLVSNNLAFNKHSQKKKLNSHQIKKKCCIQGCTRREIARFC
ncbi:prorelaxin H2 [Talpa occidentalis]|uniref:prorelaxin H2 n=1 Tax=Talpa occidentalis TaxID=50954 RepID=UPI00188EEAC8|nr:prorelaxin H2 [Talpa occidentalis]